MRFFCTFIFYLADVTSAAAVRALALVVPHQLRNAASSRGNYVANYYVTNLTRDRSAHFASFRDTVHVHDKKKTGLRERKRGGGGGRE